VDDVRVAESPIERLYREEGSRLWWALVTYTGDREMASDAVAEAFARAIAAGDAMRDPSKWVWRVGFRVATADLKSARKRAASEPDDLHEVDDRAVDVLLAIRQLPPRQRVVVVLYYLEDRSTREIASLLAMSQPTVSVHLHRARNRLRTILEPDDA
jgi:RNA polymerase sigma-70 factor (ECF subfamily)